MSSATNHLIKILVVDDDATNRLVLSALLKDFGFISVEAINGEEAVRIVEEQYIDIILLDVMMPVMDGYEATRRIRSLAAGSQRKQPVIIALSAHVMAEHMQEAREAGMDDYITKPIVAADLKAKLHDWMTG